MIGETLGPYRIESELGTGGMGKVYACAVTGRAPGLEEGQRVALKVVHPHLLETPGFFKRFLREAEVGQQIQHENVVRTYDADALAHGGVQQNFLVMEYIEGQTLRELLVDLDRVPEELCRHIGREVAKALQAIHDAGIVHRDLKPENVLITEDHTVKVMDLGVARLQEEAVRLSQTGAFVGSLHYAAPEQFTSQVTDLDGRADLHALGLLLYELSCGQHPYDDEDFRKVIQRVTDEVPRRVAEINPQLSPFFEEVVHTLLAKDREKRFPTAGELFGVLEEGEDSTWWGRRASLIRAETKRPLRRIHIPRETALYGRDDDLAKLQSLYGKAKAGDGQVLLIEGEAGIGKTRLVDEFVGALRQAGEDVNFLFGSYPPGGAATAAGGFSTAYREQFGSASLTQVLETYLAETPVLIPAFAALLRGEPSPKGEEPLTKDSLQTVFVHATRALAAERTTIVLIDDLHFAPEDGRALFTALSLALPGHRILLIGTTRPGILPEEWVAELERTDHSSRLGLHRLGPKDMVKLLGESLRSGRLAEELAGKIALKSDGNPFFVFEILRGLREGQFITKGEDGTWVSTQVIDQIDIPSSVMDLIQARIADLDDDDKNLLDVASCCGFEFDPLLVAQTLGLGQIPAMQRLAKIEKKHRLVRSAGRRFVFDHHQVQEALYAGMPELLREPYHAALGDSLEAREKAAEKDPKELDGALCVELCEHFFKGARDEQGLRYLEAALDHLEAGYLNDSAIALADRALGAAGLVEGEARIDLLLRKAARLGHLGRSEAQGEALEEAKEIENAATGPPPTGKVNRALGSYLSTISRYDEAIEVLARAQGEAENCGDVKELAEATTVRGTAFYRTGRTAESIAQQERAIALFEECADKVGLGRATGNLGLVLWQLGRLDEAKAHYLSAQEIFREERSRRDETIGIGNLGILFAAQGSLDDGRAYAERHLEASREIGYRVGEGTAAGNLAACSWAAGRLADAHRWLSRALEISREIGSRQAEALALTNLGALLSLLGADEKARSYLDSAVSLAQEIGAKRELGVALRSLGSHEAKSGKQDAGQANLSEAVSILRGIGATKAVVECLCEIGATAAADTAREALVEAVDTAQKAGLPGMEVLGRAHLAALPGGDAEAALAALEEHESRMGMVDARTARFRLFQATGDPTHLAEAQAKLMFLRDHAGDEYRESILENVPLHRDIVAAWKEHNR